MNNNITQITSKSDHDLLIELKATFDSFAKRYDSDMIQLKDGYSTKITDLETRTKVLEKLPSQVDTSIIKINELDSRIKPLERITDQIDPLTTYKEFQELKQEVHDWKTAINTTITTTKIVWSVIGAVLLYVISQAHNILTLLGIIK